MKNDDELDDFVDKGIDKVMLFISLLVGGAIVYNLLKYFA